MEGTSSYVCRGHNSAGTKRRLGQSFPRRDQQIDAAINSGAQSSLVYAIGTRQMKQEGAAVQGENARRLATYLGLARREFTQGG
jgi:hypothetical protein